MGMVHLASPVKACSELDPVKVSDDERNQGSSSSPIVVVKEGSCYALNKAKYAEAAGAKMVVFIADVSRAGLETWSAIRRGSSLKVEIPTVVISREDGERLEKFLSS